MSPTADRAPAAWGNSEPDLFRDRARPGAAAAEPRPGGGPTPWRLHLGPDSDSGNRHESLQVVDSDSESGPEFYLRRDRDPQQNLSEVPALAGTGTGLARCQVTEADMTTGRLWQLRSLPVTV